MFKPATNRDLCDLSHRHRLRIPKVAQLCGYNPADVWGYRIEGETITILTRRPFDRPTEETKNTSFWGALHNARNELSIRVRHEYIPPITPERLQAR